MYKCSEQEGNGKKANVAYLKMLLRNSLGEIIYDAVSS
jgi:hypothetical protein